MSQNLTKKFPVVNAVVSRLRSQLFEESAIVAHLLEEGEATEENINEIIDRLRKMTVAEATLETYGKHFANKPQPPSIKAPQRNPNQPIPSADIHANVPRPAGPQEIMRRMEPGSAAAAPKKKPCKDCKKPKPRKGA